MVELDRAPNHRASGIFGLWISGSGRARVSRSGPQARRALEVKAKFILIYTKLTLKSPRALKETEPGLYRAFGSCSASPALSPGLRARA